MKYIHKTLCSAFYLLLCEELMFRMCLCVWTSARIGLLVSENNCCTLLSYEDKGSAINIATDHLKQTGILQKDFHINIVWKHTQLQSDGVGNVVDLVMKENVDVIFGSPSSRITIPAAHLTSHWNFPHISWGANSYDLSDKTLFTTFVRTMGPLSESGKSLVTMFRNFEWSRIGLLYIDNGLCLYSANGIKTQFADANLTIMQSIAYPMNTILNNDVIDDYLGLIKITSRIIFLCVDAELRRFMIRAYKNGMCNGDYLFIYTGLTAPTISQWERGDTDDAIAKIAFRYLLYITTANWVGDDGKKRLDDFNIDVIERMAEPPWNSTYAKDNGIKAGSGAQNLYEAMYLYGLWLNYSSEHNISKRDGHEMLKFTKDLSFQGISGPCDMGLTGDRIPYFWIHQFVGDNSEVEIVALTETKVKKITEIGGFKWYTADGRPPEDIPICGYFNENCRVDEIDNTVVIVVICACVIILAGVAVATGYVIRRRKMEEELLQSVWKVKLVDVELQKSKVAFGSRMNMKSLRSIQESTKDFESQNSSMNDMNVNAEILMTTVALFKGQTVCVRTVRKRNVLAKEDLYDLKTMREMMHDNINPFLGACFDTPSPFMLFLYCPKGSLQDVLENDEIKLDTTFKYSLTMDLVQGMIYIHNSKLLVHGRLKSSNCLVDNRWMLKITDFGLDRFLDHSEQDNTEDHQKYKELLWTAPELLADSSHAKTKEADVYSFAIIMHEIFYRMGPFAGIGHMTAKDIVGRVRNRENDPCRPEIFTDVQEVTSEVIKLMQLCWLDNEHERPTFNIIKNFIKKNIQHGKSHNIVDIILNRLEKYASNLEELVDQRTQQLMQEKQKTDKLLYRMLPRSCADKLKLGETVLPELYESSTVFFSDIVGFTTLASKSSPMQVVDLLNDLYSCFDDIISKYDAYKVETIGDAYLVVSGIPTRNGDLHSGIIADMSLDILADTGTFRVKHLPEEEVKVRIGMHTGPCCAGVVGLSMPRYCLFGDTVNTSSRMESNGAANKIHLSEASHKALHTVGGYETSFRAEIPIKGKGLMRTYWLESSPNKGRRSSQTLTLIE